MADQSILAAFLSPNRFKSSTTRYSPARPVKAVALLQDRPDRATLPGCTRFRASRAKCACFAESGLIRLNSVASSMRSFRRNDLLSFRLSLLRPDAAGVSFTAQSSTASRAAPAKTVAPPFPRVEIRPCRMDLVLDAKPRIDIVDEGQLRFGRRKLVVTLLQEPS
jgi:hypothetical protein